MENNRVDMIINVLCQKRSGWYNIIFWSSVYKPHIQWLSSSTIRWIQTRNLPCFPQTFPTWLLFFWFILGVLLRNFDTTIAVGASVTKNKSKSPILLISKVQNESTLQNISLKIIWLSSIYLTFWPGHLGRNLTFLTTDIMNSRNIAIKFVKVK